MKKLSVVLAIYNEEKHLEECLSSVDSWADEIIVVDGGSTDQSVEIARKYKAKIISTDNPPMFHINKQKAIDAATAEWILQLDADEVVSGELKKEIQSVILARLPAEASAKEGPESEHRPEHAGDSGRTSFARMTNETISQPINGYWIPRKNFFLGRFLMKGGQYPDYTLRLYRKGKGRLPCKSVHEQAEVQGETDYLKAPLLHYNYRVFSDYLDHFKRYTTIFAAELKDSRTGKGIVSAAHFILIKPLWWFLWTYIRHKGFMDGFPGFVFSFFSALRFPVAYIKYWRAKK